MSSATLATVVATSCTIEGRVVVDQVDCSGHIQEPAGEDGEEPTGPEPLKFNITEVQRLRFMMENIQSGTGLVSAHISSPTEHMF